MNSERVVWIDGRFVPKDDAKISVYDHGLLYGDGVFEGIRIYNGRFLKLQTHLVRLLESARSILLSVPASLTEIERIIRETARRSGLENGYVRPIVTRGYGPLGVNPVQCPKPSLIVIADSLEVYPADKYATGLTLITSATMQKHPAIINPRAKSLNYLTNMMAKLEAVNVGADEAVMLNLMGFVTECVGENIFVVKSRKGKPTVSTPPLHAGILEGITMNIAIELAEGLGYDVLRDNLTRHDLYVADEIFLTGTGAEIVPVVKVDSRVIGKGVPGEVTRKLMAAFREYVKVAPED
jgi:branched-chain amino acid aminotransferase